MGIAGNRLLIICSDQYSQRTDYQRKIIQSFLKYSLDSGFQATMVIQYNR
jgi:hypothetical protein